MMDIRDFFHRAIEVDDLNITKFIQEHFPHLVIYTNEMFPNYPLQPYKQLNPEATTEDIFMNRVYPWLTGSVKLISYSVPNIPVAVRLQTSPFVGVA